VNSTSFASPKGEKEKTLLSILEAIIGIYSRM
jgi:hypothetical protein